MNWRTSITEIPRGNPGNRETLKAMSTLARRASIDPVVVQAAQDAVRGTPERDPDSDFAAILSDVRRRMRYTHDPLDAEVVKDPRYVIDRTNQSRLPEPMDCDDASTLCGAMLGAIGYSTKFVTAAVDRTRPKEWSHVYLAVQHPGDGRWIPLDPIVREFEVGDQVPAGQLTAPLAYHEGVTAMRGLGCEPSTVGVGTALSGLGYSARGMGADDTRTLDQMRADAVAAGGIAPGAWVNSTPQTSGAAAGAQTPWYEQILGAATSIYASKSKADIAASQAQTAAAQARILAASGKHGVVAAGPGIFRRADGSLNTTNVLMATMLVGLVGFAVMKAARGRR